MIIYIGICILLHIIIVFILVTIVKYMKNKYYTKYNIDAIIK